MIDEDTTDAQTGFIQNGTMNFYLLQLKLEQQFLKIKCKSKINTKLKKKYALQL